MKKILSNLSVKQQLYCLFLFLSMVGLTACGGATDPVWQQEFGTLYPVQPSLDRTIDQQLEIVQYIEHSSEKHAATYTLNGELASETTMSLPTIVPGGRLKKVNDGFLLFNPVVADFARLDNNLNVLWHFSSSAGGNLDRHNGIFFDASDNSFYFWNSTQNRAEKIQNGVRTAQYVFEDPEISSPQGHILLAQQGIMLLMYDSFNNDSNKIMGLNSSLVPEYKTASLGYIKTISSFDNGALYIANDSLHHIKRNGERDWERPLAGSQYPYTQIYGEKNTFNVVKYRTPEIDGTLTSEILVESYDIKGSLQWTFRKQFIGAQTDITTNVLENVNLIYLPSGRLILSYRKNITNPFKIGNQGLVSRQYSSLEHHVLDATGKQLRSISQTPVVSDTTLGCLSCYTTKVKDGNQLMLGAQDGEKGQVVILSQMSNTEGALFNYRLQAY